MLAVKSIEAADLYALWQNNRELKIIDVRTPGEFQAVHAQMAQNVPLDGLNAQQFLETERSSGYASVYVLCQSGSRAIKACELLCEAGVPAVHVAGGTSAWIAAGLPVMQGRGVISLDRQMRIAAGSMVLIGIVLGYFLHPAWFGLAAFVGAGLVFAGVTDRCGMVMMLARMPWNAARTSTACAE